MTITKQRVLGALALAVIVSAISWAATPKDLSDVDLSDMLGEVIVTESGLNQMATMMWLPHEFFQICLAADPGLTDEARKETGNAFEGYCILVVVRGEVNDLGQFSFFTKTQLLEGLTATSVGPDGQEHILERVQEIRPVARDFLAYLAPMLAGNFGAMGQNCHILVFADSDGRGRRIVSPYKQGQLRLDLAATGRLPSTALELDTLVDSIHVPRICETCEKSMHVSWSFCPWCGEALPDE